MPFYEEVLANDQRNQRAAAQQENSARPGTSYHQIQTYGVGQIRALTPLTFDLTFTSEPVFTSGSIVLAQPDPNLYSAPVGTPQIFSWVINDKRFYVGAFLIFDVQPSLPKSGAGTVPGLKAILMSHNLTFTATAYKELGPDVQLALENISPRPAGGF